ncbi:MAG: heparinase, partial [Lentisphaeria bacterium]|nr:heparinase [Lentisphaeria bacterium]
MVNFPYQFSGGKIDFLYDPTASTGVHNPEWQWQLNRMYFWNDMALSYLHQPDEKIASAFAAQLVDWVVNIPCPEAGWNGCGSAWRTIETGLRLMGSWQVAFEVFRKSPSLSDTAL